MVAPSVLPPCSPPCSLLPSCRSASSCALRSRQQPSSFASRSSSVDCTADSALAGGMGSEGHSGWHRKWCLVAWGTQPLLCRTKAFVRHILLHNRCVSLPTNAMAL